MKDDDLVMLLLTLLLASCQIGQTRQIVGNSCAGWSPITVKKTDIMAPSTVDSILANNCHGVMAKCWKAPNPRAAAQCKALKN
jgi:hypothetical protein